MTNQQEHLSVAIIDDNEVITRVMERRLEAMDCSVHIAHTMQEALDNIIPILVQSHVRLVFLDGNLSPNAHGGSEGSVLASLIKKVAPSVQTVGLSGQEQLYVDIPMGKENLTKERLQEILSSIRRS